MNEIILQDIEWLIENVDGKRFDNSRILITGASGAIARYLVHFFMELYKNHGVKCEVHALVRDSKKAEKIFEDWLQEKNFHLHIGNVEDNGSLARNMTYIFHAAGISATKMFDLCPVDVIKANVMGTEGLLNAVIENKYLKKMIFFSSGAVYGDLPDIFAKISENIYYPLNPYNSNGCYAEGKRMGEVLCYSYWRQYGVPTVAVRIGHSYGPGIDLYSGHIYSELVRALVEKKDIYIRNPEAVRPFTYVRDTIFGILLISLVNDNAGQAYNVWNVMGEIPVGKLADILFKRTFKDLHLKVYCNARRYVYTGSYDERKNLDRIDTKKLESLGWRASIDVVEGFLRTVKSFH